MGKLNDLARIALFGAYLSGLASISFALPLLLNEKNDAARKYLYYGLYSTVGSAGIIHLMRERRYGFNSNENPQR